MFLKMLAFRVTDLNKILNVLSPFSELTIVYTWQSRPLQQLLLGRFFFFFKPLKFVALVIKYFTVCL